MPKTKFTDNRHPYYEEMQERWIFLLLAYEGGARYINFDYSPFVERIEDRVDYHRNLHKHEREEQKNYDGRVKRSYYLNYCRPIIHIYKSHIQRKGVERSSESEIFDLLHGNIDGMGSSADQFFMTQVFPLVQVYGWLPVLVDSPAVDVLPETEAQRRDAELNPYTRIIDPGDMLDWQIGDDGMFDWVLVQEHMPPKYDSPTEKQPKKRREPSEDVEYKVWTREAWVKYNSKAEIIAENEHGMEEVPVVVFLNEISHLYGWPIGLSAINDIADLNREIYNMSSLEQEFLYKQCFNQLLLDEEMVGKIIQMGLSNAIPVRPDGPTPSYLTAPVEPAAFMENVIDRLRQEIYRHGIVRDTTTEVGQAESGVSKAFDFHDANQNIAQKAKNMQSGEMEVWRLLFQWLGGERPDDLKIQWPQEFDIRTLNEEIADIVEIYKSDIGSKTLNQELAKGVAQKAVKEEAVLDVIMGELEKVDPGLNISDREILVNRGALSPIDLMRPIFPTLSDEELLKKYRENIALTKEAVMTATSPNGQTGTDTRDRIQARLKEKGVPILEEKENEEAKEEDLSSPSG